MARGQGDKASAQANIAQLLDAFSKSAVSGAPVEPYFSSQARDGDGMEIKRLQAMGFTQFEFIKFSWKELEFQDDQHASLPVTVKWSTRDEETSRTATLRFVREQSGWRFAGADFWEVSFLWFIPLIAYGSCYGCGAVVMYWHSNRQRWGNPRLKVVWQVLALVPFSIFFYFARRPWAAKPTPGLAVA
jgi:hypothetical protein